MMGMLLHFLFVLLGVLTIVVLVQAQDQSGFISIDCGLPENSSYTEKNTGIYYISDAKFIDSGVSKSISPALQGTHQQQLAYVRSFPSGVRNCYRINVTSGTKYLIRGSFYYGNYDDLNQVPEFSLHLGANLWDTVTFPNASLSSIREIIYSPPLDYIHVCLVNTGNGTPFISAIELRTLKNDTYDTNSAASLERFLRLNLGSITDLEYRYKDDVYDRMWAPFTFQKTTLLSTSLSPKELSQNDYETPAVVMSTAITPDNASAPLKFYWDPNNVNDQYYIYMHFNEVEKLAANETRAFNITMNGKFFYGPVVPAYQTTNTIYSISALAGATRYEFSLFQTETSTLPPIINALEIYIVKDFSQSETEQDDVDAITNIKNTYGVASNWQGDPCTPVGYMWEGLNCSFDGNNPPRITSLNLSSNGLTGQIASSISKLTVLQYLDLSNNSLSGPVPDFLTQLQSLKVLNLENNNLTGFVPTGLLDRSNKGSLSLSVGQNPNLCDSASCNQQTDDKKKKKKNNIVIPVVASVAGILVLIVIAAAAIICGLKKRKPRGKSTKLAAVNIHVEPNTPNGSQLESKKRQYTFNDLVKITNNFERVLGRGGFGTVYHGFIDDTEVAVKILSPSAVRGYQQFVSEVKLLMRVHHRNLTSLIGYCNEETNIGLIYEYMPNGNLYELLSGKNSRPKFLTWEDRLRIAVDSAQGLEYLHNGCTPPIIHRDVKSTNILLNENFHAKLADFGLSKSFPTDGGTHMSTVVAGTPGYLDPEYGISNRLTEKSDVYSFGVVLLEIITSEPAIIKMNENEKTHISLWVSSMVSKGDIKHIVDSRLQEDFDTSSAWKAVEIGIACVSTNPAKRPNMSDVVTELKDCLATELGRRNTGRDTENKDSIDLVTMTTELGPLAR
ncbi:probable LRR receptor-like serine/threonine-protein kinase At1g05700 [Gastrolobium bilobum]|uniref:probable LRR receptor-like serine/threonine-protein kinase At1g05700 n=1 Tax=Gastrolobium bilobum TaxID=150636 RepID=UPI002AB2E55C|nr:probable LRR receptor-like serine/threonine-protein kinase At1g05700 [Gastrolobium bilobum]